MIYKDPILAKILEASIKHDFLIMEDRKFNDISYIVYKQYLQFCNWVDMVTVHSLVSSGNNSTIVRCNDSCKYVQ